MAGSSLLVLLDDIASVLDDVAAMSKVAARKTAGVLGDDLAVNAEKVTGVRADRELSVVWAVARGSMLNKAILVPAALVVAVIAPWLITPLMVAGGLFLCFEGFEKVAHHYSSSEPTGSTHAEGHDLDALSVQDINSYERKKIKGAVRTDFILSAEIIVLTLGIVSSEPLATQVLVLIVIAVSMTVGVYGLVAAIVKLDDAGLYLLKSDGEGLRQRGRRWLGGRLLVFAPWLMKALGVVGTIAMFMVGGGILLHNVGVLEHALHHLTDLVARVPTMGPVLEAITPTLIGAVLGLMAGAVVFLLMGALSRMRSA